MSVRKYLTSREAAARLRINQQYLLRLVREGKIRAFRIVTGGKILISEDEIVRILRPTARNVDTYD